MTVYTTLSAIKAHKPWKKSWEHLLEHLDKTKADDEPLSFATILQLNGLSDALWYLRALPKELKPKIFEMKADFAERVLHLFENEHPEDKRPREAIEAARAYARGLISQDAADAAASAADEAASATDAAASAAAKAAYNAAKATTQRTAQRAAQCAAKCAAKCAADIADDASVYATKAAYNASVYASAAAAKAEEKAQRQIFLKYFGE